MKKLALLVLIILFLSGCAPAAGTPEPAVLYSSAHSSIPAEAPGATAVLPATPAPILPKHLHGTLE
jgi:PBP1b-binding outer membrane lipoprotein LpoB